MAENQLTEIEEARAFAQAIIDTVREPVLVLDQDLRVITASRSFYRTFKVGPEDTEGRLLYELGDGHWDIPKLRLLLEKIVPENGVMEDYEVEYEFPNVGPRTMCLNARKVFYEEGSHTTILLGIEDVTRQRVLEREKDDLLRQKDVCRSDPSEPVVTTLVCFFHLHARLWVQRAPGIPCALYCQERRNSFCKTRAKSRREIAESYLNLPSLRGATCPP